MIYIDKTDNYKVHQSSNTFPYSYFILERKSTITTTEPNVAILMVYPKHSQNQAVTNTITYFLASVAIRIQLLILSQRSKVSIRYISWYKTDKNSSTIWP